MESPPHRSLCSGKGRLCADDLTVKLIVCIDCLIDCLSIISGCGSLVTAKPASEETLRERLWRLLGPVRSTTPRTPGALRRMHIQIDCQIGPRQVNAAWRRGVVDFGAGPALPAVVAGGLALSPSHSLTCVRTLFGRTSRSYLLAYLLAHSPACERSLDAQADPSPCPTSLTWLTSPISPNLAPSR